MFDYYNSAEGETITKARAQKEVAKHHVLWSDLVAEMGDRPTYDAQAVLAWLGY